MSRHNDILHFHISKKRKLKFFDRFIVVAAFLYPLTGIPQIISVYSGNARGVSLISWIGFIFFASLFLSYGIVHRIKPMMISNSLWLCMYATVVTGLIIQRA